MNKLIRPLTLLLFILCSDATAQTFTSNDYQTNLIELYTSEGCSSCPPTDEWLSGLQAVRGLWTDFIPLAFHVDYWDYIGWKDRFADKRFNARQYRYANNNQLSSVYTPALLLNGREWRKRPWSQLPVRNQKALGQLTVAVKNKSLTARFETELPRNKTLLLNLALLGFDEKSVISRGENQGETLNHNFVVLAYKTVAMQPSHQGFEALNILFLGEQQDGPTALAAWVSTLDNQTPLQAVGGWLD